MFIMNKSRLVEILKYVAIFNSKHIIGLMVWVLQLVKPSNSVTVKSDNKMHVMIKWIKSLTYHLR
jgi:uncharacterized membrane protein